MRAVGRWARKRGVQAAAALALTTGSARADAPAGRFLIAGETAYDAVTKLTWQRSAPPPTFTYSAADAYCASIAGGFRLPTVKELFSIIDFRQTTGAVDPVVFTSPPSGYHYWTTTSSENGKFVLSIGSGVTGGSLPLESMGGAFCVK